MRVLVDETIRMSPRSSVRIDGSTAWLTWCGPKAWTRTTRSSSAGSVSATVRPAEATPALFTAMPIGPSSATTRSTIPRTASTSSTEAGTAMATPPAALMAATVSSAAAASRR